MLGSDHLTTLRAKAVGRAEMEKKKKKAHSRIYFQEQVKFLHVCNTFDLPKHLVAVLSVGWVFQPLPSCSSNSVIAQ